MKRLTEKQKKKKRRRNHKKRLLWLIICHGDRRDEYRFFQKCSRVFLTPTHSTDSMKSSSSISLCLAVRVFQTSYIFFLLPVLFEDCEHIVQHRIRTSTTNAKL